MEKTTDEIERRWITYGLKRGDFYGPGTHITQGYLDEEDGSEHRIRIEDDTKAILGRKTGVGIERIQTEEEIGLAKAREILARCHSKLRKRRFVRDGWEVDFHEHSELIVAEKEMVSRFEPVVLPPWIKHAIEVTDWLSNADLAELWHGNLFFEDNRPRERLLRVILAGQNQTRLETLIRLQKEFPTALVVPELTAHYHDQHRQAFIQLAEERARKLGSTFLIASGDFGGLSSLVTPFPGDQKENPIQAVEENPALILLLDDHARNDLVHAKKDEELPAGYIAMAQRAAQCIYDFKEAMTSEMTMWALREMIRFFRGQDVRKPF
ncbi:MAG: hypothetical protein WC551_03985 [Patescibacteria group bacterium]